MNLAGRSTFDSCCMRRDQGGGDQERGKCQDTRSQLPWPHNGMLERTVASLNEIDGPARTSEPINLRELTRHGPRRCR